MSIFKKENGALVEYTNPLPADYVAPIEDGATSAHNYAVGAFALVKGVLRKITTAVTRGTAITNANSEITTVAKQLEEINTDLSNLIKSDTISVRTNADGSASLGIASNKTVVCVSTVHGARCLPFVYNNEWWFTAITSGGSQLGTVINTNMSIIIKYID